MKQLLLLIAFAVLISGCKKGEFIDETGRITGSAIYKDAITGEELIPENLTISVLSVKDANTSEKMFEFVSADGSFKLESMPKGSYRLVASYIKEGKIYTGSVDSGELKKNGSLQCKLILTTTTTPDPQPHRIFGIVSYSNLLTGSNTIVAAGTTVTLHDVTGEEIAQTTTLADGSYEFITNDTGTFTVNVSYFVSTDEIGPSLKYEVSEDVEVSIFPEAEHDLLLSWDTEEIILRIHVTDSLQNPLSGVSVCIYSNQNFMTLNAYSCDGSERNATTAQNGNVLLTGLSEIRYYISATKSVGTVELYSDSLESTPMAISPGVLNTRSIQLRQDW